MWRPWDAESEEEQQWDKSASKGIPVLASNSDDSIIFIAKKPSLSIEQCLVVGRASMGTLLDIILETASSCHTDKRRYEERTVEEAIELM